MAKKIKGNYGNSRFQCEYCLSDFSSIELAWWCEDACRSTVIKNPEDTLRRLMQKEAETAKYVDGTRDMLAAAKDLLVAAHEPDYGQERTEWDIEVDRWLKAYYNIYESK